MCGPGGGGSSNPFDLVCARSFNATSSDFAFAPFRAGDGAGQPGHDGLVIMSVMPASWKPCDGR